MATVTFDDVNRLITVTTAPDAEGIVTLNVQDDLYEAAKDQWLVDTDLNKLIIPFTVDGGGSTAATFFLRTDLGWRIQPYDASHELRVVGNLFGTDDTTRLTVDRTGRTIGIIFQRSAVAVVAAGAAETTDVTDARDVVIDTIAQHHPVPRG